MIMHILSLGAGVQSSTLALMMAHEEVRPVDCAIFADTQSEPGHVYQWLSWLETQLPFPVHRVSAGSLRESILASANSGGRAANPPFFTAEGGMLRRVCTSEFKINPIRSKVRELVGLRPRQKAPKRILAVQYIGISFDEVFRMNPSSDHWIENRWTLVDRRMTRGHCLEWLQHHGYPLPGKSACTFCPYHSDATWRTMQQEDPDAWAEAVAVDAAIRKGVRGTTRTLYLHRTRKPLDEVDFTPDNVGQLDLFNDECAGLCGV